MGSTIESYFDPKEPGSYAGASTYRRHHSNIKYDKLAEILSGYRGYTLHKPVRKRFTRNTIYVSGIDAQWEVDLADMSRLADKNDGYNYWICIVDVFSKKAIVQPIRAKNASEVVAAFEKIFSQTDRRPRVIRTDKGTEFVNKSLKLFLKGYNIDFFTSQNEETHAAIAERFIQTIKRRVFRWMNHNRTDRYIDVLDDLVSSYNSTYHRSIGMPPNLVSKDNEVKVWRRLYGNKNPPTRKYKFNVGDYVRIVEHHAVFKKGYEGGWSEEIFKVSKQIPRYPPVYRIVDWNDELIIGTFYEKELQKVTVTDNIFIVEKVLRTRRRNRKLQHFVKWLGYPNKFNSWTDAIL